MLNEGIDMENEKNGTREPMLSSKQVGRIMTEVGIQTIASTIRDITVASVKSEDNLGNV